MPNQIPQSVDFHPHIHPREGYTSPRRGRFSAMSTAPTTVTVDELQALEQKVLRAVEIVRKEREERAAAEAKVAQLTQQVQSLREQLELQQMETQDVQTQVDSLKGERENVRGRMEKLLEQLETL